jgi:hypothetical protein
MENFFLCLIGILYLVGLIGCESYCSLSCLGVVATLPGRLTVLTRLASLIRPAPDCSRGLRSAICAVMKISDSLMPAVITRQYVLGASTFAQLTPINIGRSLRSSLRPRYRKNRNWR